MSGPADETAESRRRATARSGNRTEEPPAVESETPVPETPPVEIPGTDEPVPPQEPVAPPPRRAIPAVVAAIAVVVVAALAATPFWAPPLMRLLPWGPQERPAEATAPQPAPAPAARAEPAPDPGLGALRNQAAQNAAATQQLGQRVAALEAKPPADFTAIEQRLSALGKANADIGKANIELTAKLMALEQTVQSRSAGDANQTALALALLQIREAVDLARPFDAEYRTLVTLARDRPEIGAAAQPLAEPAAAGVASRPALIERLRQLAPQIAAAKPPPKPGWKSQIVARLRSLVTVRRIGGSGMKPAEAAVATAQQNLASGDLAGAVDALSALSGPSRDAAEPWLQMARQRLAVETALRRVAAAITASLGKPAPDKN